MKLLEKLSNADAIAGQEQEVRDIMKEELYDYVDTIRYDGLGSILLEKVGQQDGPRVMLCAHMDEVGFTVRHISDLGQILVMTAGGVKPLAQFMQPVRITTQDGKKIPGVLQATYENNQAEKAYVDIGATTAEEVFDLGINVGDMVCYTTAFESLDLDNIVRGKAFDDRIGCYIIGEVLKRLKDQKHPNIVIGAGTSSEEVGIRGAKTATYCVQPDIVLPIDVACYPNEFDRSYQNKRQIGKGMMLTNWDRTLAPNKVLIEKLKSTAKNLGLNVQLDMFNRGGTDGGEAHKDRGGHPTAVACLPVRYGHCAFSIANMRDIEDAIEIYTQLLKEIDWKFYNELIDFGGGK